MAIATRSGKIVNEQISGSTEHEQVLEQTGREEAKAEHIPRPPPPFCQSHKKKDEDGKFVKLITILRQLLVNIPLVEALEQMTGHTKFMKDLVTKKSAVSFDLSDNVHHCSAIVTRSLGRPFLATGRALVDVECVELKFRHNKEEVMFKICRSTKQPQNMNVVSTIEAFDEGEMGVTIKERLAVEILEAMLMNFEAVFRTNYVETVNAFQDLNDEHVQAVMKVLIRYKRAIGWTIADSIRIPPGICTYKIQLEEDIGHLSRLNPPMQEVVKKEIIKWFRARVMYPISNSHWVIPVQCVPKKGGMTVVSNAKNELIAQRPVTRLRVCMDYRKLNKWTLKDHFPMPLMDQILDRLAGKGRYCFLDGYCGYNQISIPLEDQEMTTLHVLMAPLHLNAWHSYYVLHEHLSKGV
ncbi:uncharacterized protein LOC125858947 [Solanum stenotomum]|uniref:uncharacterized protein LOC125858947 n=1 Tax=Solanum stenotomum TaxID=172797 RepID=UPI0020D0145C|nr:uncharacterized protein LOC125858947 [Solanum stenotomum]